MKINNAKRIGVIVRTSICIGILTLLHPVLGSAKGLSLVSDERNENRQNLIALVQPDDKTGEIYVESTPEQGMNIFIDGKSTGLKTPATITGLSYGKHSITLVHPHFRKQEQTVEISETPGRITFSMTQAYAIVTIQTTEDAIISIDKKVVGTTSWSGRMVEGEHLIEVEREHYVSRSIKILVVRQKDMSMDLMLKPLKGSIEVITDPPGAMISMDGEMYGVTPKVIDDLPLGTYNITIEKLGYTTIFKRIYLTDSEKQVLEFELASGKEVTITSDVDGAKVFIADKYMGETPLNVWLKYGSHNVKVQKDSYNTLETINVIHGGVKTYKIELGMVMDPLKDDMVFIKGGTFKMGDEQGRGNWEEKPVHTVSVSDFYIGKFEVTQSQWKEIMGDNPSHFSDCPTCPVERISWEEVHQFLDKLNQLSGKKYRLPTEAEWEYAAKGGTKSGNFIYSGRSNVNFVAWHSGNSGNKTNPVGQKEPNELGLYDMSGNVWEWVSDWFESYTSEPKINPQGPEEGDFKVVKGGSWFGNIATNRVSCRGSDEPVNKRSYVGFRVALSAE